MRLDLKQAFQLENAKIKFEHSLDLSELEVYGAYPFSAPVKLTGTVENQNMVVMLRYRAEVEYSRACDRCLEMAVRRFDYSFEHVLSARDDGDQSDELILVPDFRLDIEEVAREDILLELPIKHLCSQDCAGLCPKCGCNRNIEKCGCVLHEPDPRLAALRELL